MALREELRSNGEWLFRWRSYIPLIPLLALLVWMATTWSYPFGGASGFRAWSLVCLAVSASGLVVRALTVGHVPERTSGRNVGKQVAAVLNTTGMYSLARHPLYLGNFLMWAGAAMLPGSVLVFLVVMMFYWFYYERIMFAEEEFLREKFGERYVEWSRHTPAVIPPLRRWTPPELPFSFRTVLKREMSGFFGVVATFTALVLAGHFGATGRFVLDRVWIGIFVAGLAVYLLLRFLKRRTGVLKVGGRG